MTGHRMEIDLLVIGAGSGGLSVAAGAAQMGARVVLLERGLMGGDCLNFGCVPSKALIAAADRAHAPVGADMFGVILPPARIDWAGLRAHIRDSIARIEPMDSQERFEGLGVTVLRQSGRFLSRDEVQAGPHVIRARRIVLATGSKPLIPPLPGLETVPYLTNETLWDLDRLPEHLLILGGGPIGLEMAQAFRRLGSRVTVVEAKRALAREDGEMAAVVLDALRGDGVTLLEGQAVTEVAAQQDGVALRLADGRQVAGSHLLVATGRRPALEGLDLDRAGIETEPQGIRTDARLRSTNRRVYAVGDVAGQGQFTHLAGYHAGIVLRAVLFGLPARVRPDIVPRATYTRPELAQVGLTEAQARLRYGTALQVIREPLHHNDRAIAGRQTTGLLKLMVHRGRPVGVSIAGAQAGDLIGLWALALSARLKIGQVAGMVAPYPTLTELNKRAAGTYFAPRLFQSRVVKSATRLVQRMLP
ncbi:MAG: dihydrolipoyl dehydrogenase family protein [Salipiger marinus]|uniref:dihydrolipoyl dehydrogenase family protein n=1 Tax=Salipiger marinus TaxID=555512 RepID=UPI004059B329